MPPKTAPGPAAARIKEDGYSFALPAGYERNGERRFVGGPEGDQSTLQLRDAPRAMPALTPKFCREFSTALAKRLEAPVERSRAITVDGQPGCAIYLPKQMSAMALVPLAPSAVYVEVKGGSTAEADLQGVLDSWRYEPVKTMATAQFEVTVPGGFAPNRLVEVSSNTVALIRTTRVGEFLGSAVFIPTDRSVEPLNDMSCEQLGTGMAESTKMKVGRVQLVVARGQTACRIDARDLEKPYRVAEFFVMPAPFGALVVTCNRDERDTEALTGCKAAMESLRYLSGEREAPDEAPEIPDGPTQET